MKNSNSFYEKIYAILYLKNNHHLQGELLNNFTNDCYYLIQTHEKQTLFIDKSAVCSYQFITNENLELLYHPSSSFSSYSLFNSDYILDLSLEQANLKTDMVDHSTEESLSTSTILTEESYSIETKELLAEPILNTSEIMLSSVQTTELAIINDSNHMYTKTLSDITKHENNQQHLPLASDEKTTTTSSLSTTFLTTPQLLPEKTKGFFSRRETINEKMIHLSQDKHTDLSLTSDIYITQNEEVTFNEVKRNHETPPPFLSNQVNKSTWFKKKEN